MKNPEKANTEDIKVEEKQEVPRTTTSFLKWSFSRIAKANKWWLFPFWVLLVVLALILYLSGNGALLPAIYMVM